MTLPIFDQSRAKEYSFYGEAVRLSNELRAKSASSIINQDGIRIDYPAKSGFDIETCDVLEIKNWLNNGKKKSQSLLMFVYRVTQQRFPAEYSRWKNAIDMRFKTELELLESNGRNEVEWFGETGFQNKVRLDRSLFNSKINVTKGANEIVRIDKK